MKRNFLIFFALLFTIGVTAQSLKTFRTDIIAPNNPSGTAIDVDADLSINGGIQISEVSDDETLAGDSATTVVTERAIKAYVDTATLNAVDGPASVTDNRIARFDGTAGKLIQESDLEITDSGNIRHTNGGFNIRASTTDGSDTSNTSLWGGGGTDISRGSGISTYGNEHATYPGVLRLKSGNAGSISMECNGVECFDADGATGKLTLGASAGTQTHVVNGQLNVIANSATDAGIAVTQSGLANALEVNGDSTQTGAASITGSITIDDIAIDANEISSTDVDGDIELNPNGVGEVVKIDDNGNRVRLGANPQALNLLRYPSFEEAISEATCSSCTASQETTGVMATPNNLSYLRAAFSASTGNVIVCGDSSNVDGVQGKVSGWIKTDQADVVVYPRIDSVDISSLSKPVSSDGEWRYYEIPVPMGATNACLKVEATSSITGNVDIDDVFIGAARVTAELGIQTGWEDCGLTTSDFVGFGTVASIEDECRRDGPDLLMRVKFTSGVSTGVAAKILLPNSLNISNSTSAKSNNLGSYRVTAGSAQSIFNGTNTGGDLFADVPTDANALFFAINIAATSSGVIYEARNADTFSSDGVYLNIEARIPIAEWSATTDIYSATEDFRTETKFLSSDVSTNGTTLSDLTFSDLAIGAEYEVTINCHVIAASGTSYVEVVHDSAIISVCGTTDSNTGATRASAVRKFAATATTLTFVTEIVSGTAVFQGDGTASETYAQLRRLDVPIVGLFKDVVTSPGSSNGKPTQCSFRIGTSGTISKEVGDCVNGDAVTSSTSTQTLLFNADFFGDDPTCVATIESDGAQRACIESVGFPTSSGAVFRTFTCSDNSADAEDIMVVCHGVKP